MAFKLESNEHIILVVRRHWFKPVFKSLLLFFSLIFPIIISSIVFSLPKYTDQMGNTSVLSIIFLITWLFIIWNIIFVVWTNHFLDVLVVTNLNIIDIDQIGLWHREVSTLPIQRVQDISTKTEGLIPSILNYGQLEIQSAGSLTNFIVNGVQQPDAVRQKINEQIIKTSVHF